MKVWRDNPFDPFAVARLRTTAFQKTVVMKYLDNLIAWGDQLFRGDTIESINEATQLYVLAAEILGRRPERHHAQASAAGGADVQQPRRQLGSAQQRACPDRAADSPPAGGDSSRRPAADRRSPIRRRCCISACRRTTSCSATGTPSRDRLFKIRHCMNIEGRCDSCRCSSRRSIRRCWCVRRAAGLSLGDVLSDVTAPLPNYRFSVMLQKASELASEVRSLGAALLSALEKRDAEALAPLRSGQELQLLKATRDVRARQADEADATIAALQRSQEMAQARTDYYASREFKNAYETAALALTASTLAPVTLREMARRFATRRQARKPRHVENRFAHDRRRRGRTRLCGAVTRSGCCRARRDGERPQRGRAAREQARRIPPPPG